MNGIFGQISRGYLFPILTSTTFPNDLTWGKRARGDKQPPDYRHPLSAFINAVLAIREPVLEAFQLQKIH
jgi:hypothetical protein